MLKLDDPSLMKTQSFINNEWLSSKQTFSVFNPADNSVVAEVNNDSSAEVEQAVRAAKQAQKAWAKKTAIERSDLLMAWYQQVIEHKDDLAKIMTLEQGKTIKEATGEIIYGAKFIQWYAEEAKRVAGETLPTPSNDRRIAVIKQPIGVVGMITPWNFPSSMITRKAAPAMAAGCTLVSRPASETPLSALALAELALRAGIPKGVFNVVVGKDSKAMGEVLTRHPDVAKFSFTGSTEVGKKLLEQCASTVKKVSLELGGNAPFIVFDDADLDDAVAGALASKYRNSGQTCVCANRLLVHSSIYDAFAEKLAKKVKQLKVGNGWDDDTAIGPMINHQAMLGVHQLVTDAISQGAELLTEAQTPNEHSNFYQPALLKNVTTDMSLAKEEIFGPVAPMIKFESEQQAIDIANDTRYGLAAYFYSRDIGRCYRVAEALEFGMVGINEGVISNPMAPFGGVKESGIGREGAHDGIEEYLETKYLCLGGIE